MKDKQALREAAERAMHDDWGYDTDIFHEQVTPSVVLALLDELEHYKSREERVTKLVLDNSTSWDVLYEKLEAAEKRIAEQREYYESVIADGSKRIAELEAREVTLPPTFWYEHDDLSRDVPVLDKRLVKKAIRAVGIKVKES
ncbi:ead/Ea22-like family protein [Salmonella enterica subsp. enterica serovar Florida]|nr:ead/Ea22-like family protein [Salmonella enterica subsp. enterica serovar Florida]